MLRWASDRSLGRYFKQIMRYPLLTREEEEAYARQAKLGDLIISLNGKPLASRSTLVRLLKHAGAGSQVALGCIRSGREIEITLTLPALMPPMKEKVDRSVPILGMGLVELLELDTEQKKSFGNIRQGLVVAEVEPDSPAANAGLLDYNREARDKLIVHNLRWVVTIAKQYQNRGLALSELINEGNLGLIQAVSKFDEARKTRLTTYSNWWIRYYIVTALASRHLIKLPIKMRNLAKKIRDSYGILAQRFGRTPSIEELARELEVSPEEVSCAFDCGVAELSIDALPFDDSKVTFEEVLKDTTSPLPTELSGREQIERDVRASLYDALADRELYVVTRHFGIPLPQGRFNMKRISQIFGKSKEDIQHILCLSSRKLISRLRRSIGDEGLRHYAKLTSSQIQALPEVLKKTDEPSRKVLLRVMSKIVKNMVSMLTDQFEGFELIETEIMALFWGIIPPQQELNLREIGDLLGVSREAARQVKERSIKKLKKYLRPQAFDSFFREAV